MPPAGRPRSFDREAALTRAMHVFWEKGYEGTTMADLIETIGVKAPGVYAAFGNKDALFKEVVEAYTKIVQSGPIKVLMETGDIYGAVKNSLKANVDIFAGINNPASCLVLSAAINCSPEHVEQYQKLHMLRAAYKSSYEQRFKQAKEDGQLVADADYLELSEFLMTFLHGLALRARDGSSKKELSASCKVALDCLKNYIKH